MQQPPSPPPVDLPEQSCARAGLPGDRPRLAPARRRWPASASPSGRAENRRRPRGSRRDRARPRGPTQLVPAAPVRAVATSAGGAPDGGRLAVRHARYEETQRWRGLRKGAGDSIGHCASPVPVGAASCRHRGAEPHRRPPGPGRDPPHPVAAEDVPRAFSPPRRGPVPEGTRAGRASFRWASRPGCLATSPACAGRRWRGHRPRPGDGASRLRRRLRAESRGAADARGPTEHLSSASIPT